VLNLFDSTVFLGPHSRRDVDASADAVVAQMGDLSVRRALAVSLFAIEHEMEEGNAQAAAIARRHLRRLEPVAVVTPWQFVPGRGHMRRLSRDGFRMVGFYPAVQKWPLDLRSFRSAAREAAEAGLIIMMAVGGSGEPSRAADALAGLRVPVILRSHAGAGYLLSHEFIAIGRDCPDVCFDVWNCVGAGQIALLARELGSHRLVYGSGVPLCCARSSLFLLLTAGLADADLLNVAGMTLRHLLGDTEPGQAAAQVRLDPALSRPKVDVHYHFGEWNLLIERTSLEAMAAELDTFGTQCAIISSSASLRGDSAAGNAVVAGALRREPRLRGYVYLDPYHAQPSAQDLERYAADERFVGVKTRADYHGTTLEHPAYAPLLKRAAELGLPLLTHDNGVAEAAARFPGLNIIVAHSSPATARKHADLANVHFCIASSDPFALGKDVREMIETVGVKRVLYGSDGPLISPAWTIGRFASAQLSGPEEQSIYVDNALRLFQRLPRA
jgi:hypothetical protein